MTGDEIVELDVLLPCIVEAIFHLDTCTYTFIHNSIAFFYVIYIHIHIYTYVYLYTYPYIYIYVLLHIHMSDIKINCCELKTRYINIIYFNINMQNRKSKDTSSLLRFLFFS